MEYPKIHSLWKREKHTHRFLEGEYSIPEFASVQKWHCYEKVDGCNIRIKLDRSTREIQFFGRRDDSNIPLALLEALNKVFSKELFDKCYFNSPITWIFGEGYGPNIQKNGHKYVKDLGIILFDIYNNKTFNCYNDIKSFAHYFDLPVVPYLGEFTENQMIEYVKSNQLSKCSITDNQSEGIVARTDPIIRLEGGNPLFTKLKCRDFS